VEVGADITSRKLDTLTGFSVPHPLWVGVLRGGELSRSGSLKENTFFLNLAYTLKFSALSLSLSAGPCMVMAQAELIDDFEYTEPAYPFSTVSVSAVTITEKQNIFGFNAGAALGYAFSDALSLVVNARFISAKMTLDGEGAGLIYPGQITLGGLRVGGGIQVSF
jgi:hypothetical protein